MSDSHRLNSLSLLHYRRYRLGAIALLAVLLFLTETISVTTAQTGGWGSYCLRSFSPARIEIEAGSQAHFDVINFIPGTRLHFDNYDVIWEPHNYYGYWTPPDDSSIGRREFPVQLYYNQYYRITHTYALPGTYNVDFSWDGHFYPLSGTGSGRTCQEHVFFQVIVSPGSTPPSSPPELTINDRELNEGTEESIDFSFTIGLSAASTSPVTVDYETVDGTAKQPSDYEASSGSISFSPGETVKELVINIISDGVVESDESFSVRLSNPAGATLARAEGIGTLLNDDFPPIAQFEARMRSGGNVELDASASTSGVASYDWTFSDGTSSSIEVPITQHQFDTLGDVTVTLTVIDRFGNQSTPVARSLNTCSPDISPANLLEYAGLIRCVENVLPIRAPRFVLATMRKFYYGSEDWSNRRDAGWDYIIPCSFRVTDPTPMLSEKLRNALISARNTVAEGDPSHIFTGLEALHCPSRSVTFRYVGIEAVTVHMPNYFLATWGGDLGAAAALKSYDEWRGSEQPWSVYIGPNGNRASYRDLNSDLDALVLGYAIAGRSCTHRPEQISLSLPISEYIRAYISPVSTPISQYRLNRVRCFAEILRAGASMSSTGRLDLYWMRRRYGQMIFEFAQLYFAAQDLPRTFDVYTDMSMYMLVTFRSDSAVDLFTNFVNGLP